MSFFKNYHSGGGEFFTFDIRFIYDVIVDKQGVVWYNLKVRRLI